MKLSIKKGHIVLGALVLALGAAVYLTEYATNHKLVSAIEFAAETLSGIPSILYALVGYRGCLFCLGTPFPYTVPR